MIVFYTATGDLVSYVPEKVYQGSNKANTIYFICPIDKASIVNVVFNLPNGERTRPYLLTPAPDDLALPDLVDMDGKQCRLWTCSILSVITAYAGKVFMQFSITTSGEYVEDATTTTTQGVEFEVLRGSVPLTPPKDTDGYYELLQYVQIMCKSIESFRSYNLGNGEGAGSVQQRTYEQESEFNPKAKGLGSSAFGTGTVANNENESSFGSFNKSSEKTLLSVGNGTDEENRKNAFEVLADGRAKVQSAAEEDDDVIRYIELKEYTKKQWADFNLENGEGDGCIQIKNASNSTTGEWSATFGAGNTNEGNKCFINAVKSKILADGATPNACFVNGQLLEIYGAVCAFNSGKNNIIRKSGNNAFVSGYGNDVNAPSGITGGLSNIITGAYGLTGGEGNNVSGSHSITGGLSNIVAALYALTCGNNNTVNAKYAITGGKGNINNGVGGVVLGEENQNYNTDAYVNGYLNLNRAAYALVNGKGNFNNPTNKAAEGYGALINGQVNTNYGRWNAVIGINNYHEGSNAGNTFANSLIGYHLWQLHYRSGEVIVGSCNLPKKNLLFSVGCGFSVKVKVGTDISNYIGYYYHDPDNYGKPVLITEDNLASVQELVDNERVTTVQFRKNGFEVDSDGKPSCDYTPEKKDDLTPKWYVDKLFGVVTPEMLQKLETVAAWFEEDASGTSTLFKNVEDNTTAIKALEDTVADIATDEEIIALFA